MIYPLVCGHDSRWGVGQGAVNGARGAAFHMNGEGSDHFSTPTPHTPKPTLYVRSGADPGCARRRTVTMPRNMILQTSL